MRLKNKFTKNIKILLITRITFQRTVVLNIVVDNIHNFCTLLFSKKVQSLSTD